MSDNAPQALLYGIGGWGGGIEGNWGSWGVWAYVCVCVGGGGGGGGGGIIIDTFMQHTPHRSTKRVLSDNNLATSSLSSAENTLAINTTRCHRRHGRELHDTSERIPRADNSLAVRRDDRATRIPISLSGKHRFTLPTNLILIGRLDAAGCTSVPTCCNVVQLLLMFA